MKSQIKKLMAVLSLVMVTGVSAANAQEASEFGGDCPNWGVPTSPEGAVYQLVEVTNWLRAKVTAQEQVDVIIPLSKAARSADRILKATGSIAVPQALNSVKRVISTYCKLEGKILDFEERPEISNAISQLSLAAMTAADGIRYYGGCLDPEIGGN